MAIAIRGKRRLQPSFGGEILRGLLALAVVGAMLVGVLAGAFLLVARALPMLRGG
jgi:hypothetical protein